MTSLPPEWTHCERFFAEDGAAFGDCIQEARRKERAAGTTRLIGIAALCLLALWLPIIILAVMR